MDTTTLDDGVKRRFALPVAIVLGAYAAFFLGFVKNPPVMAQSPMPTIAIADPLPRAIELPLPDVAAGPKDEQAGGSQTQSRTPDIQESISLEPLDRPVIPPTPSSTNATEVSPVISPWQPGDSGKMAGPGGSPRTADSLDRPPQALAQPQPIYPSDAKSRNLSGQVVVEFVVDKSGRVLNPRVVSSSDPVFEDATLRAIEQWRFEPGTWHGVPVRFSMRLPVTFSLDE